MTQAQSAFTSDKLLSVTQAFWVDFFHQPLSLEAVNQHICFRFFDKTTGNRIILAHPALGCSTDLNIGELIRAFHQDKPPVNFTTEEVFPYLSEMMTITGVYLEHLESQKTFILLPEWRKVHSRDRSTFILCSMEFDDDLDANDYKKESTEHKIFAFINEEEKTRIFIAIRENIELKLSDVTINTQTGDPVVDLSDYRDRKGTNRLQ